MAKDHRDQFLAEYLKYQSSIFRFIMSLVPQADEADELLQQVSMTLWQRWDSFDPERGTFLQWAIGVTRNHVRNHIRRQMVRNKHVVFDDALVEELAETREAHSDRFDQRQDALANCLERLSAGNIAIVQAFYGRTTTVASVAKSLGMSVRSLNRIVDRIRRALMDCVTRRLNKVASS